MLSNAGASAAGHQPPVARRLQALLGGPRYPCRLPGADPRCRAALQMSAARAVEREPTGHDASPNNEMSTTRRLWIHVTALWPSGTSV